MTKYIYIRSIKRNSEDNGTDSDGIKESLGKQRKGKHKMKIKNGTSLVPEQERNI